MPPIGYYEALCAEVINRLRQERELRKLSKYSIAKRSGVSQSMISLVERGLRNPTLELLLRIADAVEVDLPDLLKQARLSASKTERK